MNEYAHESSFHGLIGFEKTWKDAQPGQLTSFVKQNKNAILIFDEVEKAHLNTVRQFLSILEGGFLTDLYDEKDIDFTQTICIFTTNAGRDFFEDNRTRKLSSMPEKTLIDAIKNDRNAKGSPTMPSELLSRLAKGNIIGFDHMDPIKLRPIIRHGIEEGLQVYKERVDLTVEVDDETKTTLANLLMFHLGSELDARVASSRSKAFVIDLIYHIIESESHALLADNLIDRASRKHRSGDAWSEEWEDDVPQIDWHDKTARIVIDKSDSLAKRFLMPTSKQRFVVIALNDVQDRLKKAAQKEGHYELLEWWDRDDAVKRENIAALLEQRNVDAILIDPLFGSDQTKGRDYEGAINKGTIANDLLAWLFTRNDVPPVYIITASANSILNFNIADRDDYRRLGVRDIRRATFEDVNQIALELALEKSLASVTAGGRSLDFKANYKKSPDGCRYELEIGSFSLVASMASKAADVFVNKAEGHSEHSFDKVIGAESAKRELRRFIRFLKDPDEYLRSGQAVSKGILLYGPPGTGKTMLAKALASEADCPFISVSGADVTATAMTVAEDDKVRDIKGLFRLARRYAPSVLFIDEIDAFAKSREGGGGNAAIVNKMLTEMDGFSTQTDRPVFVIAATNSEPEKLDAALLRRFSKRVYVGLPIESERVAFLELMKGRLAGKQYGLDALDAGQIATFARLTSGSSLAEIENAIQIAQGRAAELGLDGLDYETLQDCYEELMYGEKLLGIEQELKTTAYHEAGHAFMSFAAGERFWPSRATIVGRQRFLGATFSGGDPLYASNSREDVIKRIRIALAGRATEIVFFGEVGINDGAGNDLQDATAYATTYVCTLGMDDGLLMAMDPEKALSGPLAASYVERINGILEREMKATVEFITEHRDVVQRLGEALLKESRLEREEMAEIIGDALNG